MNAIDDKSIVKEYFNGTGFDRWKRIYGDGEVNRVQLGIRTGHQGLTICDAGCGVGSLSIPLAEMGAIVNASDISEMMVGEGKERAAKLFGNNNNPTFATSDLESLSGNYDTVVCLDVLIHYPEEKAGEMIKHLVSMADRRFVVSFAPHTTLLCALKKIGEFFPGSSKATRAYLHREAAIIKTLEEQGFEIKRRALNTGNFYFSKLIEAVKKVD
jgi:magnesium-protoporphyrin O-methyltransferase